MEYFKHAPLTQAGTIVTEEGEIITSSIDRVSLQTYDKKSTPFPSGLLTVTTHRIVWTDSTRRTCVAAPLYCLPREMPIEVKSSGFSTRLVLRYGRGVRLEFGSGTSSKERDKIRQEVANAVANREWERIAEQKRLEAKKKAEREEYRRPGLGTRGVEQKVIQENEKTGNAINLGFGSLQELRQQAADLKEIAEKFSKWSGNESRESRASRGADENELLSMMVEMGIDSPVTKQSSGGNVHLYREQLSRQMAEFLRKPILNVGGVMTLSDAYCLVIRNRASTELVSPEDFRIACNYFQRLNLAIEVIRLESGVLALNLDSSRDDSGARALLKIAQDRNSISPIDVVRIRHVPIQRATAMLEDAEKHGFLARDATTDGLRFFPNLFDSFTSNKPQVAAS